MNELILEDCSPTGFRDLGEEYIAGFVTFIDILGFKNIIESESPSIINNKLDAMAAFSKLPQRRAGKRAGNEELPIVIQFSDSIIRIQPDNGDTREAIAQNYLGELSSLVMMQGNLACNGILIRGGLTYGEVCVRNGRIFGPAFNRAYAIESSLSRYPRIVVDEKLTLGNETNPIVSKIGNGNWSSIKPDILEFLDRSDDGQWTLDYLPHLYQAEHTGNISGIDVLIAHRDSIKQLLEDLNDSPSDEPKAKVRWLANYHNRIITRSFSRLIGKYDSANNSLIIDLDF